MEVYWVIEEWIPSENAIGRVGFWTPLDDGRFLDTEEKARAVSLRLQATSSRQVRLVKETREVVG